MTDSSSIHREYACFAHSRNRLKERYGLSLTKEIWDGWNRLIRSKDPRALDLMDTRSGDRIWCVRFARKNVYPVFSAVDQLIITVLPEEGYLRHHASKAAVRMTKSLAEQQ